MKPLIFSILILLCGACSKPQKAPLDKLKAVFEATLLNKNPNAIEQYYDSDLKLYTNGKEVDYAGYVATHQDWYKNEISYKIEYDPQAIIQKGNWLATRLWVTQLPSNKTIEVVMIVEFKNDKIYRLWEVTYPDVHTSFKS